MRFAIAFVLAAAAASTAIPAAAQFAKPEDAVKYRQSAMFVMSQHFGRIGAMANGRAPYDPKAAVESAEVVAFVSKLPWAAFSENTDMLSQHAKSQIWTEPAKFKETNTKLMSETGKLLAAAKTENLDNLKAAFRSTAGTCKSCHDAFRKD
jgi:cytochrome c556